MQQLQQLQRDLQNYILQTNENIKSKIVPSLQQDPEWGLTVYRDAYQIRLVDILVQEYPILTIMLGEISFRKLLSEYLYYFPSKNFSVIQVGSGLVDFIAQKENMPTFYKEIASLERMLSQTMVACDAEILTMNDLSQISPEKWSKVQFYFHPSVQLLEVKHDIITIIKEFMSDHKLPEDEIFVVPQMIIIWRQQQKSCYRSLSDPESYLMKNIAQQHNFEQLCSIMLDFFVEEEAMQWIAQTLRYWIDEEIFTYPDPAAMPRVSRDK